MKCSFCGAVGFRTQMQVWEHVKDIHATKQKTLMRAITDYL